MAEIHPDEDVKELTALFNRVIAKFNRIEKQSWDFGTGEPLTRSEIHFIVYVGDSPLCTVTELAAGLGVTKGAVSQMHAKLERKGYVRKLKGLDNDKEILLALTQKGEKARAGHEEFHREIFLQKLHGLTAGDFCLLREILTAIESFADERLGGR